MRLAVRLFFFLSISVLLSASSLKAQMPVPQHQSKSNQSAQSQRQINDQLARNFFNNKEYDKEAYNISSVADDNIVVTYAYDKIQSVDFYIKDKNVIIECQGIQHFEPIEFFGGEQKLAEQQYNDNIKTQYCVDNNARVLISKLDRDELLDELVKSYISTL